MLVLFLMVACTNPFSTREVEEPGPEEGSDIFDQPINSEVVLSNLRYALIQKNISNYISCFIDTSLVTMNYKFLPDQNVAKERFTGWDLQDEENYVRRLFNGSDQIGFEFIDKNITFTTITTSIDSVLTSPFRYELKIQFDTLAVYNGKARMKLVKNVNSLWAIYYWEDFRDETNNPNTWSVLKAIYK
jgi:hypothetical protein